MKQVREIKFYKTYFDDFFNPLDENVKEKIDEVLFAIRILERIPPKFFSKIEGMKGLFEVRVEYEGNIYRIFCCFDKENLIVLFNGFQKKTQKTPQGELLKAKKIMNEYFAEQKNKADEQRN